MSFIIEEQSGTFTGTLHRHNGYYAGDFTQTRGRTAPELAVLTRLVPRTAPPRRPLSHRAG